jgi:hypothetical protein
MCGRPAGFMSSVHYFLFAAKSVASNECCEKLKPQFPQDLSRHSQTCLHIFAEWPLTSSNTCRSGYTRSLMLSWATGCPTLSQYMDSPHVVYYCCLLVAMKTYITSSSSCMMCGVSEPAVTMLLLLLRTKSILVIWVYYKKCLYGPDIYVQ